ncbi:hypothetical protein ACFLZX_01420 [Nanoarchaeota archaeon]
MPEKKLLVDELRLSYSGVFEVKEFYKFLDDWIDHHGKEKEIKKNNEEISESGKNILYEIEIWSVPAEWYKQVIRVRALMSDVTEIIIEKGHGKKRMNKGNVLIIFDTFQETDLIARWHLTPWYMFTRGVFDRFIWKVWTNKYEATAIEETNKLHAEIKSHFNTYAY